MYDNPSIDDFKTFFSRDFPFGIDPNTSILDQDVANAFVKANAFINSDLFCSQDTYSLGFEYLAAHYLTMSLRASSQGISGQFNWPASSKAVGSVSAGYSIPQQILDNPLYSYFMSTTYGAEYLMMIFPMLVGAMNSVWGGTNP